MFVDRCSYSYEEYKNDRVLISDTFDYSNYNAYGNYSLNVFNIYTAYFLKKLGLKNIPLSVELSSKEVIDFISLYTDKIGYDNFELLVYGRVLNMIIKGNILDIDKNSFIYDIKDSKDRLFPVYYDGINTHIYNYINRDVFDVSLDYRFDFYNESKEDINSILKNKKV